MPDIPRDRFIGDLGDDARLDRSPDQMRAVPGRTLDLNAQTPGLDSARPARDAAIRVWAWARERPVLAIVLGLGMLAAIGSLVRGRD